MKLLFDQNISPKIGKLLTDAFPEATQVRHAGLEDASDVDIFQFARLHGFAIVTFDADYVDLSLVKGSPPQIIWLRTGNLTTKAIASLLLQNILLIRNFLNSTEVSILEILK